MILWNDDGWRNNECIDYNEFSVSFKTELSKIVFYE